MENRKTGPLLQRKLSFTLKQTLFLKQSQFATILFTLGLFAIPPLFALLLEGGELPSNSPTLMATITKVEQKKSPDGVDTEQLFIGKVKYHYAIQDTQFSGLGYLPYALGNTPQKGGSVEIKYDAGYPHQSRLIGGVTYHSTSGLFAIFLTFLGFLALFVAIIQTLTTFSFYSHALLAEATVTPIRNHHREQQEANETIPTKFYRLTYTLFDGTEQTTKISRKKRIRLDIPLLVFYHRAKPYKVKLLADLPGRVKISEMGNLKGSVWAFLLHHFFPLGFIVATIWTFYYTITAM